ncbi:hypothetical protein [Nitratireductor thuwali]|uniref:Uncharacterized protein n=1 Tax=Nitratireductor thuwali TaxID=2267699 RepID=A0ABY5MRW2_9HYPH|nr:hypothetical protein NTH_04030 [Nitratireductor thuwali]
MSDSEISDEELRQRMFSALFGGRVGTPTVEKRKPHARRIDKPEKPHIEVHAERIPSDAPGNSDWRYVFNNISGKRRIQVQSTSDVELARQLIREYEADRTEVRWLGAKGGRDGQ